MTTTVLSIHYLPCVEWFKHFLNDEHVILEQHEHFVKQTYRNRCVILSANGPLALTIPIKKTKHKMVMLEVEIENDFNWQKQHLEAIKSAYRSSPFYEHYEHHFEKFYTHKFQFLQQFNLELIQVCLQIMKQKKELLLSNEYINATDNFIDLRNKIHPKKKSEQVFKPYLQVFSEKFSFAPNLSIIDFIFNQGVNSSKI